MTSAAPSGAATAAAASAARSARATTTAPTTRSAPRRPFGALLCQARPAAAQCGFDTLADGSVRADDDREHTADLPLGDDGLANQMICDGDLDWFRVTVPAESAAFTLEVAAAFRDGVDIDVYVQDAAGNTVGAAASADQTREMATIPFIAPGEYFVIVDQYASDALDDSTYQVFARITGERTPCTVEGNECAGTEPLRMACNAETGACGAFQGNGEVALGSLCDSDDDCGAGRRGLLDVRGRGRLAGRRQHLHAHLRRRWRLRGRAGHRVRRLPAGRRLPAPALSAALRACARRRHVSC
jgi:hypothetical protein